jgi:hypothetical protein
MSSLEAKRCCCSTRPKGTSPTLAVPGNVSIVPLPPKCPELNAQENVWQFMSDNWLSNRVFDNAEALLDHCCDAWKTNLRHSRGPLCHSGCATGLINSDQRVLVKVPLCPGGPDQEWASILSPF